MEAALVLFDSIRRHMAEHPEWDVAANRRGISCAMAAVLYVRPFCLSVRDHVAGLLLADIQRLQSPAVVRPRTLPAVAEWVEHWGYGVDPSVIHQMLLWRYPAHTPAFTQPGARLGQPPRRWLDPSPPCVCRAAVVALLALLPPLPPPLLCQGPWEPSGCMQGRGCRDSGWYWGRPRAAPVERALRLAAALKGVGGQAGRQFLASVSDTTPLPFLPVPVGAEAWVVHGAGHVAAMPCLLALYPPVLTPCQPPRPSCSPPPR